MSFKPKEAPLDCSTLIPTLGYEFQHPVEKVDLPKPIWMSEPEDMAETFVQQVSAAKWPVDVLKRQIVRMRHKPQGRTRVELARQLYKAITEPLRIQQQIEKLGQEAQTYYFYCVLDTRLQELGCMPFNHSRVHRYTQSLQLLDEQIRVSQLSIMTPEGNHVIFDDILKQVPQRLSLPIAAEPEPKIYQMIQDPQLLCLYIQQFLSLLQSNTYTLRKLPFWRGPKTPYADRLLYWPPKPESAQKILSNSGNPNAGGQIELFPALPYPDDAALNAWSDALSITPEMAEFLYYLMVELQIITLGSPIRVNMAYAQPWMAIPPAEQIVHLYEGYQYIALWDAWYTRWRTDEIVIMWNYQYFWNLSDMFLGLLENTSSLRNTILHILSFLPQQVWLSVDKVVDLLLRMFPNPNTAYRNRNMTVKVGKSSWREALHILLTSILSGPLYWLGLSEVSPTVEKVDLFRLHYQQDLHWRRNVTYPIPADQNLAENAIHFLPQEQLLEVRSPAPANFLAGIQLWADPAGLNGNWLRYRLNVRRLHATFEKGESAESLRHVWMVYTGQEPLPEIQQWWDMWWERYGHVRLYPQQATLITRDTFTLQEIQMAAPSLREAILGLVTPRTALLQPDRVDKILDDLERHGYMPKVEDR